MIIKRISNNQKVNIDKLSLDELYQLHFDEESYTARQMEQLPPFSEKRIQLLKQAYVIIELIKVKEREKKSKVVTKGVYLKNFRAIFDRVVARMQFKETYTVVELGCGNCHFLNNIAKFKQYKIYGCDLHPSDNVAANVVVKKESIYNFLKSFPNDSIDVLVANNVCEHFMKDEAGAIYDLIYQKLNSNGKIIFEIPNLYVGPNDITNKIRGHGKTPLGFHFMEQTYKQNIKLFKKHHLYTDYIAMRFDENKYVLLKNVFGLNSLKIFIESIIGRLNFKCKNKLFIILGYNVYVLKKK